MGKKFEIINGEGIVPDGTTCIDESFRRQRDLISIKIPPSVTEISDNAFGGCWALKNIEIPPSVKKIGAWAFEWCIGLKSIKIPSSVTEIGQCTFEECKGLTNVEISAPVKDLHGTFKNCKGLKKFVLPPSVEWLTCSVFYGCTSLKSVKLPPSVTSIGSYTFFKCEGLKSIELPPSVKYIGAYAFSGCTGLKSIEIPDSVETIDEDAFKGYHGLKKIIMPESLYYKYRESLEEFEEIIELKKTGQSENETVELKKPGRRKSRKQSENGTIDVRLYFSFGDGLEAEAIDLNDDEIAEAEKNEDFEIDMDDDERNFAAECYIWDDYHWIGGEYTIIQGDNESEKLDFDLDESNYIEELEEHSFVKELGVTSRKGYLRLRDGKGSVQADIIGIKEFDVKKLKMVTSKYVERQNGETVIELCCLDRIEYDGVSVDLWRNTQCGSEYYEGLVDVPTSDKK